MALHHVFCVFAWLTCAQGYVVGAGLDRISPQPVSATPGAELPSRESADQPRLLVKEVEVLVETEGLPSYPNETTSSPGGVKATSSGAPKTAVGINIAASDFASDQAERFSSWSLTEPSWPWPILTATPDPVASLQQNISTASDAVEPPTAMMPSRDIFSEPINTKHPPSDMKVEKNHPVPRTGILTPEPLQTNKFFSNFFLGDQQAPTFTFPYSVAWAGGKGASASWGMACSHIEANQRVFGQDRYDGAASYFINPIGIQSMVISAKELGTTTTLIMDSITAFSARVLLSQNSTSAPVMAFPLVQGMAYITAEVNGGTPVIQSGVFFKTVTKATTDPKAHVSRFTFNLEDGTTWQVYAWRSKGDELDLQVINNGCAESKKPFYGVIQVCKDPKTPGSEQLLDDGAGMYPVTTKLTGSALKNEGSYTLTFSKAGCPTGNLYMFALPHHVDSFDESTKQQVQRMQLQSTTKGLATLIRGTQWTMVEPKMPIHMGFAPWRPGKGSVKALSATAKNLISATAAKEVSENMMAQTNLDSMYFSGKALAKFALLLYVVNDMLEDKALLQTGLGKLQAAFATFATNKQQYPLVYETAWGGVVSSASYVTGNSGADFGNTYYNDHHFHYGYHILAAALIGHLDHGWLKENKHYVNTLVRDVSNPSAKDKYFPLWRMFDWYHGHSWAHGLYASFDGKDEESSSEDVMHIFAIKMWGKVIGDEDMEKRANLQLAIISRSLQHYFLYMKNNRVQPQQFIGNKVAGILFENKIDHTTYFDPALEAIQGIHMIPILPSTPFVRVREFVSQEWDAFFSNGRGNAIGNAWKSILFGNYATIEPEQAWQVFSAANFEPQWLDGGASLTWLMAYSAALGGL